MSEHSDELLTVKEAAEVLKVSPYTVYRWISDGRLPAVRYSRRVIRVRRQDLEAAGYVALEPELPVLREVAVAEYRPSTRVHEEEVIDVEAELQEVKRLMDYWRELQNRPRDPSAPPRGSWEALKLSIGTVSEEDADELYRVIMEDREKSKNDPDPWPIS